MSDKNEGYLKHPYQENYWTDVSKDSNKYQFLKDSRLGTGGYRNGRYLVPHKREDVNDWNLRSSKSFYSNQYRPILQAHYKPIFKSPAKRVINEGTPQAFTDLYEVFLGNADGKGNGLQKLMERVAGDTKNLGASFLVLNNDTNIDGSIEDVLNSRSGVPYAFVITPDMVNSYTCDSFGNLTSLEWYQQDGDKTYNSNGSLTELPQQPKGQSSMEGQYIVVGVNKDSWYELDGNGVKTNVTPNSIGVLPVVRLVEDETDDIIPESSLYSVARIQHRIFNLASIITDVADNQGFSIFTMPINANSGIEFSTTKGISYPSDSTNKPEFISPDASQMKTLYETILQGLINEIYQAGVVSHLQRFQQSAESKELDRARLNDLLGTYKGQIEQAERKLMWLFGLYVGYDYGYNVTYSDDFGVSTIAENVERFVELGLEISPDLATELEKALAQVLVDFQDEEEKDALLESIESYRDVKENQTNIENQM